MDIISMQMASKAIKKIETHYSGFDQKVIATQGQLTVEAEKEFDPRGFTLKVYVDGVRATRGHDYVVTNSKSIKFKKELTEGEVILLTTDVAGVPEYHITEKYDDSELVSKISEVENSIGNIIEVLDENGDGSIVDTIANIKEQWENADGELAALVADKASKEEVLESLKTVPTREEVGEAISNHNPNVASIHELQIRAFNSEVKLDLHSAEIGFIKKALDVDGDGEIVDTIRDIKEQWENADSNLVSLIEGKASKEVVDEISANVNASIEVVNAVQEEVNNLPSFTGMTGFVLLTQAEYDAIPEKSETTVYFIKG